MEFVLSVPMSQGFLSISETLKSIGMFWVGFGVPLRLWRTQASKARRYEWEPKTGDTQLTFWIGIHESSRWITPQNGTQAPKSFTSRKKTRDWVKGRFASAREATAASADPPAPELSGLVEGMDSIRAAAAGFLAGEIVLGS